MGTPHDGSGLTRTAWNWLFSGIALAIPVVITILVLGIVTNFLLNVVSPVVTLVRIVPGIDPVVEGLLVQVVSLVSLVGLVIAIGAVADLTEDSYAPRFHAAVESLPVVGDVYRSFRRMSDVFVESEVETFQEVKLVEFPHDGAYSIAFVTADTPETIQAAAGEIEMQTLFVPLAPNPAMGGSYSTSPQSRPTTSNSPSRRRCSRSSPAARRSRWPTATATVRCRWTNSAT